MSDKSKKLKKQSTNEKIPISEKMRKKDLEKIFGGAADFDSDPESKLKPKPKPGT